MEAETAFSSKDLPLNGVNNKETDKAVNNFLEIMTLNWINNPFIN